jgi:drug/metabolite transporter (DMT)-like permease
MLLTGAGCILILSLLSAPFIWSQPSFDDLILMLGLSVAALFGQYALTNGFRYAPVYLVGALEYTALVWAAIWGYLLFHDVPTVVVMIGAAIVVSSGLAVVLSERNKPG